MKMVKLSDFYPYDRNKGGIQELHHKIESKTLQYWGEDSGILIGITPIYKIRLWSEEVKVENDKMTNMKTRTYEGVQHGDWVRCVLCGAQMLLPSKTMLPITSVSGRGPHGELILEACDKAAELAVIYADALIKELK